MCLYGVQDLVLYQLRVVCPFFTIGNNSRTIFSPTNACSPTEPLDVYASSQPEPARAELASPYDGQIGQILLPTTKYYGQIGQSLLLSTMGRYGRDYFSLRGAPLRNWFLLGTHSVSTHPHIWLAGLCSLFLCYIVASCFAYILDVAQRSCIEI